MDKAKYILKEILDAIDYAGDKDSLIKQFIELISAQSIDALVFSLSQDQQESVYSELGSNRADQAKVTDILKSHFSEEQVQRAMEESSRKMIEDWMREIAPTLSDSQKHKLLDLAQELGPSSPPPVAA